MIEERSELLKLARKIENADMSRSTVLRDAEIIASVLEAASVRIEEDAIFAGSLFHADVMKEILHDRVEHTRSVLEDQEEYRAHQDQQERRAYTGLYDFGHTAPDWENVYRLGLSGLLIRVERAQAAPASEEHAVALSAQGRVLKAALSYIERMARRAEEMGKTEMAQGLFHLIQSPPTTLFEAMQLCFLYYDLQQHVEQTFVRTLGRLDRLWEGLTWQDLACGRLSQEALVRLVDDFLRAWDQRRVNSNIPFSLGGVDGEGKYAVNSTTYLLLSRHTALKLPNVKVHILYRKDIPEDLLSIAFEGIRAGGNSIVFVNDQGVIDSLTALGLEREDALRYEVVGCYEPCAKGEVPCSCNGRVNLAKAVEAALFGGQDPLDHKPMGVAVPTEYSSYEAFEDAFLLQVEAFSKGAMALTDLWEMQCPQMHSAPFFSATMDACVEYGGDIYCHNGAKYMDSSVNLVGLATAVDSLMAVRSLVFEMGELTLEELRRILLEDWYSREDLRVRIVKKLPKYGIGDERADALAERIFALAARLVNKRPNKKGGLYRLGGFSIDWRMGFGRRMIATPDGRHTGAPLSKNLCASVGADREGATAQILSAATLDGNCMPNGSVLDLALHASLLRGENGLGAMAATLHAFMELGGMAIQYNVLDSEILRRAQLCPEDYPNLQVRLCGWNVLFANLSKAEQDEFIAQAE